MSMNTKAYKHKGMKNMAKETLKRPTAATETPDADVLNAVAGSEDKEFETSLSTRPSMDMATGADTAGFVGTISLPWLQVAHGVGGLSELGFLPGELVLGKEIVLFSPKRQNSEGTPPVRCIIVNWKQYWKQYLSREQYEQRVQPEIFATTKAAKDAGFTTEWSNASGPPTAPPAVTMSLAIEKPEGMADSPRFCVEIGDKQYAPAYMSFDKGAYWSIKDNFGTAVNYICKDRGISSVVWDLTTSQRTSKTGNTVWVPMMKIAEHLTDDQIAAVSAGLTG